MFITKKHLSRRTAPTGPGAAELAKTGGDALV